MNIKNENVLIFKLINGAELIAEVDPGTPGALTITNDTFRIRNPLQLIQNQQTGCDYIPYIMGTEFPTEEYTALHKSAVCVSNIKPIPELVTAYVYTVDPPPELILPPEKNIIVPR